MRGFIPPRPTGSSRQIRFSQAVWDMLWGGGARINSSDTVKTKRTTKGISLSAEIPPMAGGGADIRYFAINTLVGGRYYMAREFDNQQVIGPEIGIVKPRLAWQVNGSMLSDGTYDGTELANQQWIDENTFTVENLFQGVTETFELDPPFAVGQIIIAAKMS